MKSFSYFILLTFILLSYTALSQNTITTNSPVQTSFCAGGNIVVQYTSTGTFAFGCVFTAELSDAMGNFTTPVVVGSMPLNTGVIAGTIPQNTSFGFNYRVRVVASNPYTVGSVSPTPPLIITSTAISATIVPSPSSAEVCEGNTVSLWVAYNASYYWSTGETTQTISVTDGGIYRVTVTNFLTGCEVSSNPIEITVHPTPIVNLGPNIELCNGQNSNLDAGPGYVTYNWSNGSSGQLLIVNNTNNYSVMVTDQFGCTNSDTVSILVHPNPIIDLGNDTVLCGNYIFLSSGIGYNSYSWNNGLSFNPSLLVETSGTYFLSVLDSNNCSGFDTIIVDIHNLPSISLGNDLSACGNSIVLNAGPGFSSYNWNNGLGLNQFFPVNTTGTYNVKVTDQYGCNAKDTIIVNINSLPDVNLGLDILLELNNTLILDAGSGYLNYQWNTGTTSQTLQINGWDYPLGPITFSVTVMDANGCFNSDQITITIVQPSGINEISNIEFKIFAIPFSETLTVISNQNLSESKPILCDILGKYYYPEFTIDKTTLTISRGSLSTGSYILFIENNNERVWAGKLIIN